MDPKPTNFMMTPENCLPVFAYTADYSPNTEDEKDPHLLNLIDELETLKHADDVRPILAKKFKVRQLLKNSKLI